MVSLVGISFNVAAWLTHKICRKMITVLPEESLEILELKNTMVSELDKISEQVRSQSVAKLLAAESFLRQGNVHLLDLMRSEGVASVEGRSSTQIIQAGILERDSKSIKEAISWFRKATESATEAFMDKKNVKTDQRLAALKIMIFCATIEHYDNPEKAEYAVRNVMIDLSNDSELVMILQNEGDRFFGLTKDAVWRGLTQFMCEVSFLISDLRLAQAFPKKLRSYDAINIRKIVADWGVPNSVIPVTFPDGIRTIGNLFVKTFYGDRVLACGPPGKVLLKNGNNFAVAEFSSLKIRQFLGQENLDNFGVVVPFEKVGFCVSKSQKFVERLKFENLGFHLDSDNRFDLGSCFRNPEKELVSLAGIRKKSFVLAACDSSELHIISLKTAGTRSFPLSSAHRKNRILCGRSLENSDSVEIAMFQDSGTITRMTLDTATGGWKDIQVIRVPGRVLGGIFCQNGDLVVLSQEEKSGEIRLGVNMLYSDESDLQLTCRLWSRPKVACEKLGTAVSMCLSEAEGLLYVGLCI